MELRAATFNLRTDTARDGEHVWPHRAHRVAEMIRRLDALVVGTQEASFAMLSDLSERLPDYRWIGQGRRGGTQDEFSAILYRPEAVEAEEAGDFWLSETPEQPGSISWNSRAPRMCTWVRCQSKDAAGRRFLVYNTHLDHVSDDARLKGIELICQRVQGRRLEVKLPALLMGDLNSGEASRVVRYLRGDGAAGRGPRLVDAFSAIAGGRIGATFHGFRGGSEGEPIDYVFGTDDVEFASTQVRRDQIDGGYPSDHYPVVTRARFM